MENHTNKIYQISAPGKIILSGEHAVGYGQDALALALSLRCKAIITKTASQMNKQQLSLVLPFIQQKLIFYKSFLEDWRQDLQQFSKRIYQVYNINNLHYIRFIYKVCQYFQNQYENILNGQSYTISISSDLPIGKCLGSSASFNVVLATCLLEIYGYSKWIQQKQNNDINQIKHQQQPISNINDDAYFSKDQLRAINRLSLLFEVVEHGSPSGIDNYVATFGGIIHYSRNSTNSEFIQIHQSIYNNFIQLFNILIIDTNLQKNTKQAIKVVSRKSLGDGIQIQLFQNIIHQIGTYSKRILQILSQKSQQKLSKYKLKLQILDIISKNHIHLSKLGVSNQIIDGLVQKYTINGKSAGKITGAGMGGYILVLVDKQYSILQFLQDNKNSLVVGMENQGVKIKRHIN